MGNVTVFEPPSRRIHPELGEEDALNLDAVGAMGKLLCQVALLSRVEKLAPGESVPVIHNGVRSRVGFNEDCDLLDHLMHEKDDLRTNLGARGVTLMRDCLRNLVETYQAAGWDLPADLLSPDNPA